MNNEEHPLMCYTLIPKTDKVGAVGIVKWGECGYYKTDYPENYTKELVKELNESLGVDALEAEAMRICSMFATEENWESHYNMVLSSMSRKETKSKFVK